MLRTFIAFGSNDLKSVRRDSLLLGVIVAPWLLVLSLRLAVPPLTALLQTRYAFDLTPYYPLILCFFLFLNIPLLFGVMTGFLMLDERDDDTLTALRVTPASLTGLINYRLLVGFVFSTAYILLTTPLSGLVNLDSVWDILLPSVVAALFAPVVTLFLVTFAKNKLEGFALMKAAGIVLLGPIASFFIAGPAQYLFGILPTFWSLHAFVAALAHEPYALYLAVGAAYNLLLIGVLYRRYQEQFVHAS
jgi:fluoroquinolone transport system permease protein